MNRAEAGKHHTFRGPILKTATNKLFKPQLLCVKVKPVGLDQRQKRKHWLHLVLHNKTPGEVLNPMTWLEQENLKVCVLHKQCTRHHKTGLHELF